MQRIHIKIQALLWVFLLLGVKGFAQENTIKWAPFKLAPIPMPSALQFGYERIVGEQISVGLSAKLYIPQNLTNSDLLFESNGTTTATGNFQSGKFNGVVVTPEFRYYTSSQKGAPNGFYLTPFLRYFNLGINGVFDYRPADGSASSLIDAKVNFSGFGGGFGIGVQKVWDSGFLIDWNAGLGLAITGGRLQGEVTGPVSAEIPAFIDDLANAVSTIPLVNARFSNEGDGLNARASGLPLPIVKTHLAIGYPF